MIERIHDKRMKKTMTDLMIDGLIIYPEGYHGKIYKRHKPWLYGTGVSY